jgi:hypothetical protein
MQRDSTIFYRSFYEAINSLPNQEDKACVYRAIFEYSLNFKEVELDGVCKTIWLLIKPQLDANLKRFENGNKAKTKQTKSKTEAKQKQNRSKVEANNNNNVNNNDNVNNNVNKNFNFRESMIDLGFDVNLVDQWIQVRKTKKLTNTETAFNSTIEQMKLCGKPKNELLKIAVENSWGGFKKAYYDGLNKNLSSQQPVKLVSSMPYQRKD